MSSGAEKVTLVGAIFELILKYQSVIDFLVSVAEKLGKLFGWDGSQKQSVVVNAVAKVAGVIDPEAKQIIAAAVDTIVEQKNVSGEFIHIATPSA
jgi:hypothetical protein